MRVVYESVLEKIEEAVHEANRKNRQIKTIFLTYTEAETLHEERRALWIPPPPNSFDVREQVEYLTVFGVRCEVEPLELVGRIHPWAVRW